MTESEGTGLDRIMNHGQNRIVLSVLMILVCGGVLWVLRAGGSRRGDEPMRPAASSTSVDTSTARASLDEPAVPGSDRIGSSRAMDPVEAAARASSLTLECLRRDTGDPVPGALVHWWPSRTLEGVPGGFESWLRESALEQHASEAVALRTDRHGRAEIPDANRGGSVMASADGLWGRASIENGREGRITLVLEPDVDLAVRVIDAHAVPVPGTTVVLRQPGHAAHTDHLLARSDSNGIAVLRHAGLWWEERSPGASGYVVAVPGLLNPACARLLDAETLAEGTIELVLEPSGSCEIELVDEHGRRLPAAFVVQARLLDGEGRVIQDVPCEVASSRADDRVLFEHVELGCKLSLAVARDDEHERTLVTCDGPRSADERVHVRVGVPIEGVNLVGRVVDAQGAPLRGIRLSARLESAGGLREGERDWQTGSNGRGEFVLELPASSAAMEDVFLSLSVQAASGVDRAFARRALPRNLSPGTHDLGDFTLEEAPLVVDGRVVDAGGQGVAGALVSMHEPQHASGLGNAAPDTSAPPNSVRSDSEGHFSLHGESASDEIVVHASRVGHADCFELVRRGTRSVQLVLGTAGSIHGTVLLDPSLASSSVLVAAERGDVTASGFLPVGCNPVLIDGGGRFVLRDVGPGTYSVRVLYVATGEELGRIDQVVVPDVAASRDVRLDALDLRAAHRLLELQLVDASGAPVRGGSCRSRASDDPAGHESVIGERDGRLPLLYSGRPLDVCVTAPGQLSVELERVSESRVVSLPRAARVRLELACEIPALPAELRLLAILTPTGQGGRSRARAATSGHFDSRGVLVCETSFVGEARIDVQLVGTGARDAPVVCLSPRAPLRVRLLPDPSEQVFRIDCDPREIERALATASDAR